MAPPTKDRPRLPRQRGFTLIELLTTIVILGFVIGVMSGAFSQVAQILRVAAESGSGFQERWLRTRALQELVSNLALSEQEDSRLIGGADHFEAETLASPLAEAGAPQRVRLRLVPVLLPDRRAGTELRLQVLATAGSAGAAGTAGAARAAEAADAAYAAYAAGAPGAPDASLAPRHEAAIAWTQWPGRLRFGFIDRAGKEFASWPPSEERRHELPGEVLLRPDDEDAVLVRSAVFEGPLERPRRAADVKAVRDFLGFDQ